LQVEGKEPAQKEKQFVNNKNKLARKLRNEFPVDI